MPRHQKHSSGRERTLSEGTLENKNLLVVNVGSLGKRFILEAMKAFKMRIIALQNHRVDWAEELVDDWIIVRPDESVEIVKAEVRRFCEENGIELDGAITFWEEDVPMVAHITEEFGLPGNSVETAMNTRDKFSMVNLLRDGIPQHLVRSRDDLEEAIGNIGFPAVFKPLFGSDSQSVMYIENAGEARSAYEEVTRYSNGYEELVHYEEGIAVYQRYIPGREFSVECAVQDGMPRIAGINEKLPMKPRNFMKTGVIAPVQISAEEQAMLETEAMRLITALNIQNSLVHTEMKLTPDGKVFTIETASRMGGAYIQQTTNSAYGFDLIRAGCEIAVGIPVSQQSKKTGKHARAEVIIPETSGKVTRIEGLEALQDPRVSHHHISASPGTVINVPPKGYDSAGWVMVEGDSPEEAHESMSDIMSMLSVTMEEASAESARS